jgi:hypothetical protein
VEDQLILAAALVDPDQRAAGIRGAGRQHPLAHRPLAAVVRRTVDVHHDLGTGGSLRLIRADGTEETLLELRDWDFDWQLVYHLAEPRRFHPGDELRVECRWDNSAANQPRYGGERRPVSTVTWGEGTTDEMCVANLYISEP